MGDCSERLRDDPQLPDQAAGALHGLEGPVRHPVTGHDSGCLCNRCAEPYETLSASELNDRLTEQWRAGHDAARGAQNPHDPVKCFCGSTEGVRRFAVTVSGEELRLQPALCAEHGDMYLLLVGRVMGAIMGGRL